MTLMKIKHDRDLTNEFRELQIKVNQARNAKRMGLGYRKLKDWGRFNFLNSKCIDYCNAEFVYRNSTNTVDYFPIRNENVTILIKQGLLRIACLNIDVPFKLPPSFTRIRFVHVYPNYLLVNYVEAGDALEFDTAMYNILTSLQHYIHDPKRADYVTAETKAELIKKFQGFQKFVQDKITEEKKVRLGEGIP